MPLRHNARSCLTAALLTNDQQNLEGVNARLLGLPLSKADESTVSAGSSFLMMRATRFSWFHPHPTWLPVMLIRKRLNQFVAPSRRKNRPQG